jgi:chemotaxis protein methyltransferase WspC
MKHSLIASQTRRALDALHESVREPLPRAQVARFAALLHRTIGLDAASIGDNAIERAVADRYAAWRASRQTWPISTISGSR